MDRKPDRRLLTNIFLLTTLFLLFSSAILNWTGPIPAGASHLSEPFVGVWSDTYRSNNITDRSLTPGSEFTVKVNVTETPDINTYEFFLRYNAEFLIATKAIIKEGTFFGDRCSFLCNNVTSVLGVVRVSVSVTGEYVKAGDGILAFITFQVVGTGATALRITGERLALGLTVIPHTTENGIFSNTEKKPPVARFIFSPLQPVQGNVTTFDASTSSDPDSQTLSYFWRWGDETGTSSTSNPIITHVFRNRNDDPTFGSFSVSLTVTDDTGLSDTTTAQVTVTRLPFNDVLVASLSASLLTVNPGQKVTISVTVANSGTFDETTSLTVLVGSRQLFSEGLSLLSGQTRDFEITWDTTGFAPDVYRVTASVSPVPDESDTENNSDDIFVNLEATAIGASTALILGSGLGALAVIGLLVFLVRRRKPPREA